MVDNVCSLKYIVYYLVLLLLLSLPVAAPTDGHDHLRGRTAYHLQLPGVGEAVLVGRRQQGRTELTGY